MRRRAALLPLTTALAALAACAPRVPPGTGPGGPTAVHVPPGCEAPLGGEWRHATSPSWRYLGEDDGGTLVLAVQRVGPDDGGTGRPGDEGGPRIELQRGPDGFVGRVVGTTFGPGDRRCTVSFPTEVVACTDGGLTLSTASKAFVDAECNPAPGAAQAPREVHQLVRPEAGGGAPDGGTP